MVVGIIGGVAAQVQIYENDSGLTREGTNLLRPLHLMCQEGRKNNSGQCVVRDTTTEGGPLSHSTARKTPLTISSRFSFSRHKNCILSVKIENVESNFSSSAFSFLLLS